MSTVNQKIEAFRNERALHVKDISEIMEKSGDQTLDAANQTRYDELVDNVKTIDAHIGRLEQTQALLATGATVVVEKAVGDVAASQVRATGRLNDGVIAVARKSEPGVRLARLAMTLVSAKGDHEKAAKIMADRYPEEKPLQQFLKMFGDGKMDNQRLISDEMFVKATVAAGTTTDAHWAGPLVQYQLLVDEFLEWLRPQTVIDRIPGLRKVPFNVRVPKQVSGGAAYWPGEGKPKPLTSFAFEQVVLGYTKIASIAVITQELARLSSPSAETVVRDQLAAAIIQQMDADFLDPANAGTANVKPASITNGSPSVAATGTDYTHMIADLKALFGIWIANNMNPAQGVWIMPATQALALTLMQNPLGQPQFPDLTLAGGTLRGLPVIVSQTAGLHGASGSESIIVLCNPSQILLADDGRVTIDTSTEASLQMLDNPTNASADGTATTMVSMFQTNSIAVLAERWIDWVKGRNEAAVYLTNANYG